MYIFAGLSFFINHKRAGLVAGPLTAAVRGVVGSGLHAFCDCLRRYVDIGCAVCATLSGSERGGRAARGGGGGTHGYVALHAGAARRRHSEPLKRIAEGEPRHALTPLGAIADATLPRAAG